MKKILIRTAVFLVIIIVCSTEFIPNSNMGLNISKERYAENINKSSTDSNSLRIFLRNYSNKSNRKFFSKAILKNPIIPDEATAIEIAKVLCKTHYSSVPLKLEAVLIENNTVWRVGEDTPPGMNGGNMLILDIRKIDGKVLYMQYYGK